MLQFMTVILFLVSAVEASALPQSGPVVGAMEAVTEVDSLLNGNKVQEAMQATKAYMVVFEDDIYWSSIFENRLAIALLRTDQPLDALPFLENWVRDHPNEAQGHQNLGACLVALGRKGRALSEYQQVVELDPDNPNARLEYGQVLLDFRIYRDAHQEILTAASLCGDCLEVQPLLAQYFEAVNQPAKAAASWRILWLETGNPVARRNLLKALLDSGQDQAALELLLEKPVVDLPGDELQQMVAAEGRLGTSEQSLIFVNFLILDPFSSDIPPSVVDDPVFWGQISHNLLLSGHHQAALAAVDRAVALSPQNVVFLNNRVVLLQKLGRQEDARRAWDEVLILDPSLERK